MYRDPKATITQSAGASDVKQDFAADAFMTVFHVDLDGALYSFCTVL